MAANATQAPHRLPSVAAIEKADTALLRAHEAAESISVPTKYAGDSGDAGEGMAVLPTRADIGELYLFASQLKVRSRDFAEMAKEIEVALQPLGCMAGNAELAKKSA
jgi:hypothetical protein